MSKIVAPPLLTLWLFLQTVPILSLLMVLVFLMVPEISEALPLLVTNILTILIIVIIVTWMGTLLIVATSFMATLPRTNLLISRRLPLLLLMLHILIKGMLRALVWQWTNSTTCALSLASQTNLLIPLLLTPPMLLHPLMLQVSSVFPHSLASTHGLLIAGPPIISATLYHYYYSNLWPVTTTTHTITIPNGVQIYVDRIGDVQITPDLLLTNVLFVPQFRFNLISIPRLCQNTHSHVHFTKTHCWMQSPLMTQLLPLGKFNDGLYTLEGSISYYCHY